MNRAGFYTPAGSRTLSRRGWASRHGFSPSDLPGLRLWLDAQSPAQVLQTGLTPATNGTRVVRIVDRAQGLQFDEVSSSGPTLIDDGSGANGRRLLRFNGSSQYLRHVGTISTGTAGEVFVVMRPTKVTSGTWVVFGSADEAGGNFFWYLGNTVTGGGTEYFRYYERNTGSVDTLTLNTEIGRAAPANCYLLHVRSDATGTGTISAEVNEAPQTLSVFSGTNNGDWIGNVLNRDSVGLGALLRDTVSAHFGGDVYEIIQVDGVLTVPQRVAVNRYLRQRYAPLIQTACLGDSLTSASPGYVDTLRTSFGDDASCSISFVNHGVGGEAIAPMRTRWDANIEGRGYRALVLMGGVNDLRVASAGAAAAIWPNFTAIYDEAIAAGMRIVACTVAPFGNHAHWSSTRQSELVALNGMIASYVAQHPQEMALVDGNALLRTPGTPEDLLAAYDSGDGLHWNTAGHDVFAAAVETALRGLLGE